MYSVTDFAHVDVTSNQCNCVVDAVILQRCHFFLWPVYVGKRKKAVGEK